MSDLAGRIASLPPEKRALLAARLARVERENRPLGGDQSAAERLVAPLAYTQRGVWFLDQLYPGNVAYNSPMALRFSGRFNAEALEWSWNQVVRRHDLLRTVFEMRNGEPVQYATSFRPGTLRKVDFFNLPESERMEAACRQAVREAQQAIDLASGSPWRVQLLTCSEREHIFVVILHHIICDGWSIGVLIRELVTGYEAFISGHSAPLPRPTIQYAHFAAAQPQQLANPNFGRQVETWRKRLAGFTEAVQIPSDRPRPAESSFRGTRVVTHLRPELVEPLRRLAHAERATPFMVFLGAFKVLLARYSGQSDIVVGSPIANRERREYEGLIGFFANTLALRTDLSGDLTFVELLARVKEVTLSAYDCREIPFEKLVEELKPERQLNRNPFFDISFSLQNFPMPSVNIHDVGLELLRIDNGTSKFDLSVVMMESQGGFATTFEYSTDLFDASTAERLLRHYVNLLEGVAENPRRKISQYKLLTQTERAQIAREWNATRVDYPRDRCIHELFQEQAKCTPHAVAAVYGKQEVLYGELDDQSSRLAHHLKSLGVRVGSKVAFCLEPSTEMIVGLLGILKAGAAYVPIDPNYPHQRMAFIVADVEARVVLTQKTLESQFRNTGLRAICLDAAWESVPPPTEKSLELVSPDAIAYVLFTSGSTGTPKGVCVPHRGVTRLVVNCDYVQLGLQEVIAQVSNCCFDAATFEIWGALLNGGRLVGISQDDVLSPERFSAELTRHGVTTLLLTTAVFNALAHERPALLRNLRNVLFGGEECDSEAVRKVLISGPPQRLLNVYGPTEATTFATTYLLTAADRTCADRIPIGRPIANTQVYILDSHREPAPIGVTGEIWIGGDGVAHSYLRRPELTAERFIDSPFVPGERLFRTGDLGRFLPDGNIVFLGRMDHQVKIRGFRIELGEVEAALNAHPAVRQAVVCVREDEGGVKTRRLVAYVVPADGGGFTGLNERLSAFLKEKLPDYMVPSAFVILEKFPLSPTGKIDRHALPAPVLDYRRPGLVAPRNETEKMVAQAWSAVIDCESIGVYENFFQLGGHSLLAMQVISRLRSAFGLDIPLRVFFENATVAALAEYIDGAQCSGAKTSFVPLAVDHDELVL